MAWKYIRRTYNRMFLAKNPKPPFQNHVVQIGDPVLRNIASPIHPDNINSKEVQNVRTFGKHMLLDIHTHYLKKNIYFFYCLFIYIYNGIFGRHKFILFYTIYNVKCFF